MHPGARTQDHGRDDARIQRVRSITNGLADRWLHHGMRWSRILDLATGKFAKSLRQDLTRGRTEMNSGYQKFGNKQSQREGIINVILRLTTAVVVIILSMTVLVSANEGNMVLSLVWPILLLPLLSASKELCILLTRFIRTSH
jgi:hypothetical protein